MTEIKFSEIKPGDVIETVDRKRLTVAKVVGDRIEGFSSNHTPNWVYITSVSGYTRTFELIERPSKWKVGDIARNLMSNQVCKLSDRGWVDFRDRLLGGGEYVEEYAHEHELILFARDGKIMDAMAVIPHG